MTNTPNCSTDFIPNSGYYNQATLCSHTKKSPKHAFAKLLSIITILRSCFNLYRLVFYRAKVGCLLLFQGRIAGYVTA